MLTTLYQLISLTTETLLLLVMGCYHQTDKSHYWNE